MFPEFFTDQKRQSPLDMRKFKCIIWDKVFKNGQSKICGREPLKKLNEYGLLKADHTRSNFLKAVLHKFYLVRS